MAKRYTAAQWRSWLGEFPQSGLTVAKFCDSIDVSVQSYYKWRRKLMAQSEQVLTTVAVADFVPLTIGTPTIQIELPGGASVRVPNDTDSLRPILQVLIELGVNPCSG